MVTVNPASSSPHRFIQQIAKYSCSQSGATALKSALALSVIFMLPSMFLAQKISTPLRRMATTFARLKQGDPVPEVNLQRNDELGLLARNFSIMAKKLNAQLMVLNNQHQYFSQGCTL